MEFGECICFFSPFAHTLIVRHHLLYRGLVTRFPVLSAIVSSATFLAVSLLVLAACILPAVQWRFPSKNDDSTELREDFKPSGFRKRRQRGKVSPRSESTSQSVGLINLISQLPLLIASAHIFRDIKLRIFPLIFLQKSLYLSNPYGGVAPRRLMPSMILNLESRLVVDLISVFAGLNGGVSLPIIVYL